MATKKPCLEKPNQTKEQHKNWCEPPFSATNTASELHSKALNYYYLLSFVVLRPGAKAQPCGASVLPLRHTSSSWLFVTLSLCTQTGWALNLRSFCFSLPGVETTSTSHSGSHVSCLLPPSTAKAEVFLRILKAPNHWPHPHPLPVSLFLFQPP